MKIQFSTLVTAIALSSTASALWLPANWKDTSVARSTVAITTEEAHAPEVKRDCRRWCYKTAAGDSETAEEEVDTETS
ncbi:hypothetical protein BJX70DRAFT_355923, partial [Aspergillus crustosus]